MIHTNAPYDAEFLLSRDSEGRPDRLRFLEPEPTYVSRWAGIRRRAAAFAWARLAECIERQNAAIRGSAW